MAWEIELEKAVPYAEDVPHFWHCRISNSDLGFSTANDGCTPGAAVARAKQKILEDIKADILDLLDAIKDVAALQVPPPNEEQDATPPAEPQD